jgi:hypothetical protein
MNLSAPRLRREHRTVAAMLAIHCQDRHGCRTGLCVDCQALLDYAAARLGRCVFGPEKPTCVSCPVHCYRPGERDRMRAVMRHAGPRMIWRHPFLALRHLLDGLRRGGTSRAGASSRVAVRARAVREADHAG